jgi:hypothetical protein
MNNTDHNSESLETIFEVKIFKFFVMRIRDPGWKKFGSGMEEIRIQDFCNFEVFFLIGHL